MEVGIVEGTLDAEDTVSTAVRDADVTPVVDTPTRLVDRGVEAILLSGWSAVRDVTGTADPPPLLVLESPDGLAAIETDDVTAALREVNTGERDIQRHVPLTVACGDRRDDAVAECMLMTTEPATISEYRVTCRGEPVCQYRADGMVLATPAGSREYTRAAGGPILDPATAGCVLVPIAPYRTDPDQWVLAGDVAFEVLRDAGEVGLFVDGAQVDTLARGDRVKIEPGQPFDVIRTSPSQSPF